jgi:hypothetical protein
MTTLLLLAVIALAVMLRRTRSKLGAANGRLGQIAKAVKPAGGGGPSLPQLSAATWFGIAGVAIVVILSRL